MLGHEGNEHIIALSARQPQLLVRLVALTHERSRRPAQLAQHIPQLRLSQRLLGVLAVGELDTLSVEQGDRLAARASSLLADQGHHGAIPLSVRSFTHHTRDL